ncbi:hypothetical protein THRCLA_11119 [Thraustotheca clavata]|uniref:Uncharacterized protein n=1 Tax=Thraustotheca clavata TaxID=74557 RepID=A0A1V9Y8P6_9STRA|nr:hypothetical protein THRCLA_11119 [Thraustotheca clavata]
MTITTTVVLVVVAVFTTVLYMNGNAGLSSHHLLFFNRVAGPVWLGRPLTLLRGTTSIIILSTSPIVFDSSMGLGRFHFEPRSIFYRFLFASEALWFTDVTSDIFLIFTHDIARVQAPVSSLIFWLAVVCLESASPIRATAMIDRSCTRVNMDFDLTCTSGTVNIGSFARVLTIVGLDFLSVFIGSAIALMYQKCNSKTIETSMINMLPASALAFCPVKGDLWTMNASTACMSGIFRFYINGAHCVLDTKLWVVFTKKELMTHVKPLKSVNIPTTMSIPVTQDHNRRQKLFLILGLLYLVGTVGGSLSYIQLADVNFSNDFWWANFNSTGTLTFIVNWYDKYRAFTSYLPNIQLDNVSFADIIDYSQGSTVVIYSPLYASMVQFNVANDIALAIYGLRQTDGCLIPWIATQYCWLDFDRLYPMAATSRRQERCEKYKSNGAVYLEAPLRNIIWSEFESCWGKSFEIAIAKDLQDSSWINNVKSNLNSVAEEIVYWSNCNITSYTVQWQNFKSIGLMDSFYIENAFGISYPINMQTTNGTFRLGQESSMKMYWTFARDLWAVNTNESLFVALVDEIAYQKDYFSLPVIISLMPVLMDIKPHLITGGSFLCAQMPAPASAFYGMGIFYSFDVSCGLALSNPVLSDPTMIIFCWMYFYDWAMGLREVVHINGDISMIAVISSNISSNTFAIDAMEVPRNLSAYCRALCQYLSFILALLTIASILYSYLNRFTLEGLNLFKINRVGGLVWIERSLLLVQSLTALAILSTCTLELQVIGNVTVLAKTQSDKPQWKINLIKLLPAGEVSWLLYIIQDLAMVFTQETTGSYSPISCIVMWFISMCLSVFIPVTHQAMIDRKCTIDAMDYQLVYSTGTLVIGSLNRFLLLTFTSIGISIVFYIHFNGDTHCQNIMNINRVYYLVVQNIFLIDQIGFIMNCIISIIRQQYSRD